MFVLSLPLVWVTFTPSALPDFIAIPVPIPRLLLFAPLPFGCFRILDPSRQKDQESFGEPGCLSVSLCCSMPSVTPGSEQLLVSIASAPAACVRLQSIGPPIVSFGANYRIQLLSLHLATFPLPRVNLLPDLDTGG